MKRCPSCRVVFADDVARSKHIKCDNCLYCHLRIHPLDACVASCDQKYYAACFALAQKPQKTELLFL